MNEPLTGTEETATMADVDIFKWYEPLHKILAHKRPAESYSTTVCGEAIEGVDTWYANASGPESDIIKCLNCRGATDKEVEASV